MTKVDKFNEILLCAIEEALNSLGKSVKEAIYFHIKNKFNVSRDEIPRNLQEFQGGIEKIFGAGACFIEILIMKTLYSKVGLPLKIEGEQLEFVKCIEAAREGFRKKCLNANLM